MGLASGYAERSRKTDLIIQIQMARYHKGILLDKVKESTKGYRRAKLKKLEKILREETKEILFIKAKNVKAQRSQAVKNKVFASMPERKGYNKVYKPYGSQGKGFYYIRKETIENVEKHN